MKWGKKSEPKYRVGLALSGGGARGIAHLGVLKALEDLGLKPDIVAGVSAGSIVAALYDSGITINGILELFSKTSFSDFADFNVATDGFFKLDKLKKTLKKILPVANIEDLKIPTIIGATDLDSCKAKGFTTGPIAERVIASCSLPIVFKPVKIDGVTYVDGGVLHNLPANYLRPICKYVIGVNVSPFANGAFKSSILDIALRSFKLMSTKNMAADMKLCDVGVTVQSIAKNGVFDVKHMKEMAKSGYFEAMKVFTNSPEFNTIINGQD
jgi:NTE family protein